MELTLADITIRDSYKGGELTLADVSIKRSFIDRIPNVYLMAFEENGVRYYLTTDGTIKSKSQDVMEFSNLMALVNYANEQGIEGYMVISYNSNGGGCY